MRCVLNCNNSLRTKNEITLGSKLLQKCNFRSGRHWIPYNFK